MLGVTWTVSEVESGFALFRQIELHGDVVAAGFAGFGDEFFDAVFVNRISLFHGVGIFAAATR